MPLERFLSFAMVTWLILAFAPPAQAQDDQLPGTFTLRGDGLDSSQQQGDPMAPLLVIATPGEGVAIVAWIPGGPGAMTHKIYGYRGGGFTLLETAAEGRTVALIANGQYDRFGVSAVIGEKESARTSSINVPLSCVKLDDMDPPEHLPGVNSGCLPINPLVIKPRI